MMLILAQPCFICFAVIIRTFDSLMPPLWCCHRDCFGESSFVISSLAHGIFGDASCFSYLWLRNLARRKSWIIRCKGWLKQNERRCWTDRKHFWNPFLKKAHSHILKNKDAAEEWSKLRLHKVNRLPGAEYPYREWRRTLSRQHTIVLDET